MRLITPAVIIASALAASPVVAQTTKPQYVLISFDGAHDNKLWTRSRELAKNNNAHFTYFLSCVFLMTKKDRRDYQPPHKRAGASNVGFALSHDEVVTRLDNVWQAHLEGNEIASHGCGHFDGTNWSTADWDKEIKEFRRITAGAYKNNGIDGEPEGWQELARNGINGFRAPYLAASKPVQDALKANGFRYQASSVTRGPELQQLNGPFASFGLPLIPRALHNALSSAWITTSMFVIQRARNYLPNQRSSRTVPTRLFALHSTSNMTASAFRCSSAFTSF